MKHLLAALLLAAITAVFGQTLEVTPARVMIDESAVIRAQGLEPNEHVTIQSELVDGMGVHWTARAEFVADAQGIVDLSKTDPVSGSYKAISSMGLVWSMMPRGANSGRYAAPRDMGTQEIEFQLLRKNQRLASAKLEQVALARGVRRMQVRDNGLRGVLFLPPGGDPHPGVLVLGGSEGGMPTRRAAWLAGHGYAALALAYFHFEDLPQNLEAIPLEYFGRALNWMTQRPEIARDQIAVMGVSRGGELTLQLGATYPKLKALVAYVPADTRHPACCGETRFAYPWTLNGQPLAFEFPRFPDPARKMLAAIEVERMQGPILMISGGSDGVWPSASMTDAVLGRLKRDHFAFEVERLNYPHAGHTAGRPEIVPAFQGTTRHPVSGANMNAGGSVEGNAESTIDAIPKVLDFLARALGTQR